MKQWIYKPQKELFAALVHDISLLDGYTVAIDTSIDMNGWFIEFFNRKGGDMESLYNLLSSAKIDVSECPHNKKRYSYTKTFDYEADKQTDLSDVLQEIINKLSKVS